MVNLDYELNQLQGFFPSLSRYDFHIDRDDNHYVIVKYHTTGRYSHGSFTIKIIFPYDYPESPPDAWLIGGYRDEDSPHIYGDDCGDLHICYIDSDDWRSWYSAYDAAGFIQTWIYAYCEWISTGYWTELYDH